MSQTSGYIRRAWPDEDGDWTEVRFARDGGTLRHVYPDDELPAAVARALATFGSVTVYDHATDPRGFRP